MANSLHRVEASIRSLYIFNSNYGQNEGQEDEKIFYYHPKDIELNTKIKDVGLSEAIISFINDNNACERVHTMKTNQVFYEAEYNFWIVLTLNVPKELRSKDNGEDYQNSEICDAYYRRILEQSYSLFRLKNGSFEMILDSNRSNMNNENDKVVLLKDKLENFYDEFVENLTIPNCSVLQYMGSVQYLSLDKTLFLKVHNFMNIIKATFPLILDTLFLHNDSLLCAGKFHPMELFTIYNHVLDTISKNCNGFNSNNCNNLHESTVQEIFVMCDNILTPIKLLIYHINSTSLCLFFKNITTDVGSLNETCEELNNYVNVQLNILANEIGDYVAIFGKISSLQPQCNINDLEIMSPKYLFINEQTLKHLTNIINVRSMRTSNTRKNTSLIPTNVMHTLINLINSSYVPSHNADKKENICIPSFEETVVKSTSDFWIIKRQCNWRQFYVIIFSKKATLLDVTAEAERIFQQHIKDDVFFDK